MATGFALGLALLVLACQKAAAPSATPPSAPTASPAPVATLPPMLTTVDLPGYSQTSTFRTLGDGAKLDAECAVLFHTASDGPRQRADVAQVKQALDYAVAGSTIMRDNLLAACLNSGSPLLVAIKRDDPQLLIAHTTKEGLIELDLGDIDKAPGALTGPPEAASAVARSLLPAVLAHELVHVRDGTADRNHEPAIQAENAVLAQLGFAVVRNNYGSRDAAGATKTYYDVAGQSVVLNASSLALAPRRSDAPGY